MKLKNTKVLVTGATGFMGRHLVERLLKEGADVHAIVENGKLEGVNVYIGDITDAGFVKRVVDESEPKVVYHLAALINRNPDNEEKIMNVNKVGTFNLLDSLKGKSVNSFVFVSTAEVYGDNVVPFKEDMNKRPTSVYSLSKDEAENICFDFYENSGVLITIIRPVVAYGPGQTGNMFIPSLVRSLIQGNKFEMTKGEQTRDFVYVDDVVEGMIKSSLTKGAIGEVINICSGKEHILRKVSEIIYDLINNGKVVYDQSYRKKEQMRYFGDNSKAKRILGWEPKIDLEEGLRRTVEWHKSQKSP
tara:strand:- start:11424 stop:12332 length:909 start_codon:yes stop_codon:yes gene_type:complete